MLTGEAPTSIWVLGLMSIAIGEYLDLHDSCVFEFVKCWEQLSGDEVSTARTQRLIVELHRHWTWVSLDDQGVEVLMESEYISMGHERKEK